MIVGDYLVVTLVVIIAEVVLKLAAALYFLSCWGADEIDIGVVFDLLLLVVCELVREVEQGLFRCHRELGSLKRPFRRALGLEGKRSANGVVDCTRAIVVIPVV